MSKKRNVQVFIESKKGMIPLKFLNRLELAEILNVSVNTIDYWNRKNEIPVIYFGKHPMFILQEVLNKFHDDTVEKKKSCNPLYNELNTTNCSLKIGYDVECANSLQKE